MNPIIELKLVRRLLDAVFNDKNKIIEIDAHYYKVKRSTNVDCLSIIKVIKIIKNANILSEHLINDIYLAIFPSIKKHSIMASEISTLFSNHISRFDYVGCFCFILKKHLFHDLTWIMACLVYNMMYYIEYKNWFIIPNDEKLFMTLIRDNNTSSIMSLFDQAKKMNDSYHIKKNQYSINQIVDILNDNRATLDALHIKKVFLYGSYAKNLANEYSDIDLQCVLDRNQSIDLNQAAYTIRKTLTSVFETEFDIKTSFDDLNNDPKWMKVFNNKILIYVRNVV